MKHYFYLLLVNQVRPIHLQKVYKKRTALLDLRSFLAHSKHPWKYREVKHRMMNFAFLISKNPMLHLNGFLIFSELIHRLMLSTQSSRLLRICFLCRTLLFRQLLHRTLLTSRKFFQRSLIIRSFRHFLLSASRQLNSSSRIRFMTRRFF